MNQLYNYLNSKYGLYGEEEEEEDDAERYPAGQTKISTQAQDYAETSPLRPPVKKAIVPATRKDIGIPPLQAEMAQGRSRMEDIAPIMPESETYPTSIEGQPLLAQGLHLPEMPVSGAEEQLKNANRASTIAPAQSKEDLPVIPTSPEDYPRLTSGEPDFSQMNKGQMINWWYKARQDKEKQIAAAEEEYSRTARMGGILKGIGTIFQGRGKFDPSIIESVVASSQGAQELARLQKESEALGKTPAEMAEFEKLYPQPKAGVYDPLKVPGTPESKEKIKFIKKQLLHFNLPNESASLDEDKMSGYTAGQMYGQYLNLVSSGEIQGQAQARSQTFQYGMHKEDQEANLRQQRIVSQQYKIYNTFRGTLAQAEAALKTNALGTADNFIITLLAKANDEMTGVRQQEVKNQISGLGLWNKIQTWKNLGALKGEQIAPENRIKLIKFLRTQRDYLKKDLDEYDKENIDPIVNEKGFNPINVKGAPSKKTIVRKQINKKTGKTRYTYSDGTTSDI
jgi:hypothetical protein